MKKQAEIVSEVLDKRFDCEKLYRLDNGSYRMVLKPGSMDEKKQGIGSYNISVAKTRAGDSYIGLSLDFSAYAKSGVITRAALRTNLTNNNEPVEVYYYNYQEHKFGDLIGWLNCEKGVVDLSRFIKEAQEGTLFLAINDFNSTLLLNYSFLEIDFIDSNELLNNQKYVTMSADELTQVSVNILSGTIFETLNLFQINEEGDPISLNIFYNSADQGNLGLETGLSYSGMNFYTNFHQICYKDETNSGEINYIYLDSNRVKHVFRPVIGDNNLWVDTQGTGLLLRKLQGPSSVEIFDERGSRFLFDSLGRIEKLSRDITEYLFSSFDVFYVGNTDKIDMIKTPQHIISFQYGNANDIKILLDGEEKIQISFSQQNMKVNFLGLTGETAEYSFFATPNDATEGLFLTLPDGTQVEVEYALNGRVKTIKYQYYLYALEYGYLESSVKNEKDIIWVYSYNERGEFLASFENKDENDYSVSFRSEDPCIIYEGTLSEKKEIEWENYTMEGPDEKVYDTVEKHFPTDLKNCFAFFSFAIRVEEFKTQKPIKVSATILADSLVDIEFTPEATGIKFFIVPIRYNSVGLFNSILLKYKTEAEGKFTFMNACLTLPTNEITTITTNMNNSDETGYEFQRKALYFITKNQSIIVDGTFYSHTLYISDYLANERNFYTRENNSSWNMWVDNMRMMITGVQNLMIQYEKGIIPWHETEEEKIEFILLAINTYIMNGTKYSHRADEQKSFVRFGGWDVTSFMHQTNVSYTRDVSAATATSNYSEDLYYDKYNNLLYFENEKRKEDYDYNIFGSLTSKKSQSLDNADSNILNEWDYNDKYLTAIHTFYLTDDLVTHLEYNNMGSVTRQTAPNGFQVNLTYYPFGISLQSLSAQINTSETANLINYKMNKISSLENKNRSVYSFEYDDTYKTMISKIYIGGVQYAELKYEFNYVILNSKIDKYYINYANNGKIYRAYDKYGRLSDVTRDEKVEFGFHYGEPDDVNSQSKLTRIADTSAERDIIFSYNSYGNVENIEHLFYTDKIQCDLYFSYDDRQRVKNESIICDSIRGIETAYQYETGNNADQNNVKAVFCSLGNSYITYEMFKDDLNRLEREEFSAPNAHLLKRYTYADRNNERTGIGTTPYVSKEDFYLNSSETAYKSNEYTYDKNGNITSIRQNGKTIRYEYDEANRLILEVNPFFEEEYRYSYDPSGNLTKKEVYSINSNTSPKSEIVCKYNNPSMPDQLTDWGSVNFSYDECGNMTFYDNIYMSWAGGRLLERFGAAVFAYDYNGIRSMRKLGDEKRFYITNDTNLLAEIVLGSDGKIKEKYEYFYDPNGIFGFSYAGDLYYYVKNLLGDIIEIRKVDSNELVASYIYDAWGNHKVQNVDKNNPIGDINPFRYRGYYYDTYVKMYYLQTRWYDPVIGRFINLDQISYLDPETVNGLNLYAYCQNNPVMGYDPDGTIGFILTLLIATLAGALIKGGINAFEQLAENDFDKEKIKENFDWNEVWGETIEGAAEGFAYGAGGVIGAKAVGTISLGTKALVALGGAAVLLNGAAGIGSYALQNSGKDSFNVGQMFLQGFNQIESGIINMMIGESFVHEGIWIIGNTKNLTPEMKGTLLEQRILKKAFLRLIYKISKFF